MSPKNARPGVLQQQPRRISDEQKQQQAGHCQSPWHGGRQMDAGPLASFRATPARMTQSGEGR
ncbi:MAG: hypothetical protein V4669_04565 [Pseudomonadota bacterium]